MNAFYICGLEAKYAEEFNRNTRRLSQTGESSEVWPISKNRESPLLNKLESLSSTLVRGWVQNRWGLCEELPGTSSSLEGGQAKNRGMSLMHGLFVARSQVQNIVDIWPRLSFLHLELVLALFSEWDLDILPNKSIGSPYFLRFAAPGLLQCLNIVAKTFPTLTK